MLTSLESVELVFLTYKTSLLFKVLADPFQAVQFTSSVDICIPLVLGEPVLEYATLELFAFAVNFKYSESNTVHLCVSSFGIADAPYYLYVPL